MNHNYNKLQVYQRSVQLAIQCLNLSSKFNPKFLRVSSQLYASSLSIPSNIAEGAERRSPKEFRQFLHIALGSASELSTQLIVIQESEILQAPEILPKLIQECKEIRAMIRKLIDRIEC